MTYCCRVGSGFGGFLPKERCNVPVHDTSCSSPYFLSGAFARGADHACRSDICKDERDDCCENPGQQGCKEPGYEVLLFVLVIHAHPFTLFPQVCTCSGRYYHRQVM